MSRTFTVGAIDPSPELEHQQSEAESMLWWALARLFRLGPEVATLDRQIPALTVKVSDPALRQHAKQPEAVARLAAMEQQRAAILDDAKPLLADVARCWSQLSERRRDEIARTTDWPTERASVPLAKALWREAKTDRRMPGDAEPHF